MLALALIAGAIAGFRWITWCRGAEGPRTPVAYTVPEGASGSVVVDDLERLGIVRCGVVAGWELRRSGLASSILAGDHVLATNMTPLEAFGVLTSPPPEVPTITLTIPEGYRLTQIADAVEEALAIPARDFLRAARESGWSLPPYLPADAPSLEGFLFPDTYEFREEGTTAEDVIRRMLDTFAERAADLPWDAAAALGLQPYEVVIVASMIEEEARVADERAWISGVIRNRLAIDMPLGIDAVNLYADPTPQDGLTSADFATEGPYNVRLVVGLPPTPIASPGLASLLAALQPADVDYLYYVLCGDDGSHAFSVDFATFSADKARCLG